MRAIARDYEKGTPVEIAEKSVNAVQERVSYLSKKAGAIDVAEIRGTADSLALKHRYHDADLHRKLRPAGGLACDFFDAIEEARVEAIGARKMLGVRANLAALAQERALKSGLSTGRDTEANAVAAVLGLIVRERLTGESPPEAARVKVESQRMFLEKRVGHLIDLLIDNIENQRDLSLISLRIVAKLVGHDLDIGHEGEEADETMGGEIESSKLSDIEDVVIDSAVTVGHDNDVDQNNDSSNDIAIDDIDNEGANPGDGNHQGTVPWWPSGMLHSSFEPPAYKVFTDAHDVVSKAEELCDVSELDSLRKYLDQQMFDMSRAISKLANQLQRRLLAFQRIYWQFDLEEGILDTERLSRVITNPQSPCSFKAQSDIEFKSTIVTLLLDNSGSLRGRPILVAAIAADVLTRTLERCGVKVEILGFTTNAWNGGRSFEKWIQLDKPSNPGRLNDLLHIIYKAADTPFRKVRRNLGLMMREGLLKENIDGEALLWAHNRLIKRAEERRILMVISDGAPVDDSTLTANSKTYLETHLRRVINWIETRSPVELVAIGIGHDVTRFYSSAQTIADVEELGTAMTERITALFDRTPPRPRMIEIGIRP